MAGSTMILRLLCCSVLLSLLSQFGDCHFLEVTDDFCVDRAFQTWHLKMVSRFSRYAEFTSFMSSSRSLFQALFSQDFTSDSFNAYCSAHKDARKQYETCPDSGAKDMANIDFALADHICIKRVEAFSRNIPCLQNANVFAFSQCRNSCSAFESGSHRFTNPTAEDLDNQRMNWIPYMASDCQYLKCMTSCRKPIFEQKCGTEAGALEYDALRAAYAKKIDYYDPQIMRNMMKDSFIASIIFPLECQQLVDDTNA